MQGLKVRLEVMLLSLADADVAFQPRDFHTDVTIPPPGFVGRVRQNQESKNAKGAQQSRGGDKRPLIFPRCGRKVQAKFHAQLRAGMLSGSSVHVPTNKRIEIVLQQIFGAGFELAGIFGFAERTNGHF
jgi:hypothetical protein